MSQSSQQTQVTYIQEKEIRINAYITCSEGFSEKQWRILRSYKIRSTFYTESTLCKLFCKLKDWVATEDKNYCLWNWLYNREAVYFGQSKQSLKRTYKMYQETGLWKQWNCETLLGSIPQL